ncbi:MAG: hypothetical protein FWC51_03740 [Proteobacteria bacterium]|nr:hypothetical protein [Pseudomonadota bacterium]
MKKTKTMKKIIMGSLAAFAVATAATCANAAPMPAQPMVVNARPMPIVQQQKVVQRPNMRPAIAPRPQIVYVQNNNHRHRHMNYAYNNGYNYNYNGCGYNGCANYNNGAATVAGLVTLGLVTGGVIYALAK